MIIIHLWKLHGNDKCENVKYVSFISAKYSQNIKTLVWKEVCGYTFQFLVLSINIHRFLTFIKTSIIEISTHNEDPGMNYLNQTQITFGFSGWNT